jgi:hypothetical protein
MEPQVDQFAEAMANPWRRRLRSAHRMQHWRLACGDAGSECRAWKRHFRNA